MNPKFRYLLVLVLLSCVAESALTMKPPTCAEAPVPFSRELIGRSFGVVDDCFKADFVSSIRIYRKLFVFRPFQSLRDTFLCPGRVVFHYRRGGTRPFLVYFPRIEIGFSEDVSDVEQFCKEKQDKAKIMAFPVGKTRPLFIKTIRDMVKELKKMRAFACGKNKDGLLVALPGPNFKNVAVDGIITYLITIGYNNFFCVE